MTLLKTAPFRRRGTLVHPEAMDPPYIPAPHYRHASPSGPWPWMDFDYDSESDSPQLHYDRPDVELQGGWEGYPQSLFPNWTPGQVTRSGISRLRRMSGVCVIRHVDVGRTGQFSDSLRHTVSEEKKEEFWSLMQRKRPDGIRVRALFVEDLSLSVLQMLGTKYNIEPFYFSSSFNWIPSHYQENVRQAQGDHITITLTFIRAIKDPMNVPTSPPSRSWSSRTVKTSSTAVEKAIDTQLPLSLRSNDPTKDDYILLLDLLAIHVVRTSESSTIISYHPHLDTGRNTSAKHLHGRVRLAGQSVYWQDIFQKSQDPTFVLLTILWYALYAWDEAMERLWVHICRLEVSVLSTNNILFTRDLHALRAHLLHYSTLLDNFRKSVNFILETPNPAMDDPSIDELERQASKDLMRKECANLLKEIDRLMMNRDMQDKRLENVMNLAFNSSNIEDSHHMRRMTEATLRDSAAMKQVSYLTMVFLPASFVASVFGMNVREIVPDTYGSVAHYVALAIPLTTVTIWILVAFHGKWHEGEDGRMPSIWTRLWWPFKMVSDFAIGEEKIKTQGKLRGRII